MNGDDEYNHDDIIKIRRLLNHPNFQYFDTFDDLLSFGRFQLTNYKEGHERDDLTGIESQLEGEYLDQMIRLNHYMYTTYSTNFYEYALSFEGVMPLDKARKLARKLKKKGLWYIIFDEKKTYEQNIDLERSRKLILIEASTGGNMARSYDDFLQGRGWWYQDGKYQFYISAYLLQANEIEGLIGRSEVYDYTNHKLFRGKNPLVTIIIEDPVVERKTLYEDVYNLLST